jgi:hypothetical protein
MYTINIPATDVSPGLVKPTICRLHADSGIQSISNGIRALDMEAVKARTVDCETLGWPAVYYFSAAYKSLIRETIVG